MRKDILRIAFLAVILLQSKDVRAFEWKFQKGEHFIVQFAPNVGRAWARSVLREAEYYYDQIARKIGYTRYHNFWTWNDRVKIVIYSDQESYLRETGLPKWSKGGSTKYHRQLNSRAIVSFRQEKVFLKDVLPHEIAHLILGDFIGHAIPLWFNEGVAQLSESYKKEQSNDLMKRAVAKGHYIPFRDLINSDVRVWKKQLFVTFFYAQSVSVIDFMIREYGSKRFGQLCREMRDGKSFSAALKKAYTSLIESVDDLEKKWLYSLKK